MIPSAIHLPPYLWRGSGSSPSGPLAGGLAFLTLLSATVWAATKAGRATHLDFTPIDISSEDAVRVPAGYTAQVVFAWGDPVSDGPAFRADAGNSAVHQALQGCMHHDGMHFFPMQGSSTPGLLCINHEYTDDGLLHRAAWPTRAPKRWPNPRPPTAFRLLK